MPAAGEKVQLVAMEPVTAGQSEQHHRGAGSDGDNTANGEFRKVPRRVWATRTDCGAIGDRQVFTRQRQHPSPVGRVDSPTHKPPGAPTVRSDPDHSEARRCSGAGATSIACW